MYLHPALALAIALLLSAKLYASIVVDQFGYGSDDAKIIIVKKAVHGTDSATDTLTPGKDLRLVDVSNGAVVSAALLVQWKSGTLHAQSGDRAWLADFSQTTASGRYFAEDTFSHQRSLEFEIRKNPWKAVLRTALRMFYYQRCGFIKEAKFAQDRWADPAAFLQDSACHDRFDPANTARIRDMRGGWFDAGDYNKYVTFASQPVHQLLLAYSLNPSIWTDNFNIPESGNSLPDILDEIKWELNWLLRMQDADGGVYIKMGDSSYVSTSPPSANKYMRFYGKKSTASTIAFAGMMAHAAVVYSTFSSWKTFADTMKQAGRNAWAYYAAHPVKDTAVDNGEVKSGDADWSAAEQIQEEAVFGTWMFTLTKEKAWDSLVAARYQNVAQIGWWGPYGVHRGEALLAYTTVPGANASVCAAVLQAKKNGPLPFCGAPVNDPFRADMPDAQYHWGSSQVLSCTGLLNSDMVLYGCSGSQSAVYLDRAASLLHYLHGSNPLNKCYLSNMYAFGAKNPVNEMYHGWFNYNTPWQNALFSQKGPAPGYLVGGPNAGYAGCKYLPKGQPPQKEYADFNDPGVWPNSYNPWEITEPAIYYQAAYVRLLSAFVNTSDDTLGSGGTLPIKVGQHKKAPAAGKDRVLIYDIRGRLIFCGPAMNFNRLRLTEGVYFIRRMDAVKGLRIVKSDNTGLYNGK